VNGAGIESDAAKAVALSLFAREQLSMDACAHTFVLYQSGVGSSNTASLHFLLSGGRSERVLSGPFGKAPLECHLRCRSKPITRLKNGRILNPRIVRIVRLNRLITSCGSLKKFDVRSTSCGQSLALNLSNFAQMHL
jgi:hypothetical protein